MSIGIDVGEVGFKAVRLSPEKQIQETFWKVHSGEPEKVWEELKEKWQIVDNDEIVVTGFYRNNLPFPSVPQKVAQDEALNFLYPDQEVKLIRLGGGGFSVLQKKNDRQSEWRQNPPCAAGTGSFLDQMLNRLEKNILNIDQEVEGVVSEEMTGRCAVTTKSDATHRANQGSPIKRIAAGLLDSLAKNAATLALKLPGGKVIIIGGLSVSKRIAQTIQRILRVSLEVPNEALFFEALGAALIAAEEKKLALIPKKRKLEIEPLVFLPPLKNYLNRVTKMDVPKTTIFDSNNLVLGTDVGSTGSKIVGYDGRAIVFDAYCDTKGEPVAAAKNLIPQIPEKRQHQIKMVGCTGSGREVVAAILRASLPKEQHQQVFVLNEIAAHGKAAANLNKNVDTIFDIGGQDSKFILMKYGNVFDFNMNTVCSAGTGSFLAEQLQLLGITDVRELGRIAMTAPRAADLGQHCAVFMAKRIAEARRRGATIPEIVAGLYYSIARNVMNRVKGARECGENIFLQGKPAENIALACALAMVTGRQIVLPPWPGLMGAFGIAILTLANEKIQDLNNLPVLNLKPVLETEVLERKEFQCQSKEGCVTGNQCRVQMIQAAVKGEKIRFFWNDRCGKWEKVKKNKLLAQMPRPFQEREKLIANLIAEPKTEKTVKTVGLARGLEVEEILPLVITFFQELGLKITLLESRGLKTVEEGAKLCQANFCAPLQSYCGQAKLLETEDFIFLPKVIEIEGQKGEERCYACPLTQASPDMIGPNLPAKVLQPFLNFKKGYHTNRREFVKMAILQLGCSPWRAWQSFEKAVKTQKEFEMKCQEIGRQALEFGRKNGIPVIVVLGHPYITNSDLLSANVAEIIEESGAIALPAECYPLKGIAPKLGNIYWGYGHRLLDVAYEVRREAGVFPLWLSVYSCGPDSFLLHFFQYLLQGKPYSILESDAYTGQAGFKTRVEAFLYSIKNYQEKEEKELPDLARFEIKPETLDPERTVLLPWMGEGSIVAPFLLQAIGLKAEYVPMADENAMELGRQHTSGKECLPMVVTLAALLKYLRRYPEAKFYYFMPRAGGPCRFGQYQLLFKIILEKLGLSERVKVISPTSETGYHLTEKFGPAMIAKAWVTFVLVDLLKDVLHEIRPAEKNEGESEKLLHHYLQELGELIIKTSNDWSGFANLWGMENLAKEAVGKFLKIPRTEEEKPVVVVTGEIFVRLDDFSNNHLIKRLEALGVRVKLAPFREWINYTTFQRRKRLTIHKTKRSKIYLTWLLERRIESRLYRIFAEAFGWKPDHHVEEILKKAKPYLSRLHPLGEASLTIGLPLLLWEKGEIDGAIIIGPGECMPSRIGEEQVRESSKKTGLPLLCISFYGDSKIDEDLLESFVWDLKMKKRVQKAA